MCGCINSYSLTYHISKETKMATKIFVMKLVSVSTLTKEEQAQLAAASRAARPGAAERAEFAKGVRCWRAEKRRPLVYGRAS